MTADELAAEALLADGEAARAVRVLPVAVQLVEDYAAGAPQPLKDEATIRIGAYLLNAGPATTRADQAGDLRVENITNHAAAFRNSGAAMLLTRYKARRGGAIG